MNTDLCIIKGSHFCESFIIYKYILLSAIFLNIFPLKICIIKKNDSYNYATQSPKFLFNILTVTFSSKLDVEYI